MSVKALRERFEKPSPSVESPQSMHLPVKQTLQLRESPKPAQYALSVKQLTLIFELLSRQYGVGSSNWIEMVQNHVEKGDYHHGGKLDIGRVVADIVSSQLAPAAELQNYPSKPLDERIVTDIVSPPTAELQTYPSNALDERIVTDIVSPPTAELQTYPLVTVEPEPRQTTPTSTTVQIKSKESMMENLLPKILTRPEKHDCDMIVCGIVSKTLNGHRVHEIDLKCHGCQSQFVLSAAHACEVEDDQRGLEWLSDGSLDCINVIL